MSCLTHIVRNYGWIPVCAAGLAVATTAFAQEDHRLPSYALRDIGTLDGGQAVALGMNEHGVVVGWSDRILAKYPVGPPYEAFNPGAHVKNRPPMVGWADEVAGPEGFVTAPHAFFWSRPDGIIDLGTLGGSYSEARDVNDDPFIVGLAETAAGVPHAFLATYAKGEVTMWDLNDLVRAPAKTTIGTTPSYGAFIEANAISNAGEIIACAYLRNGDVGGFLLVPRTGRIEITPGDTFAPDLFTVTYLGRLPGAGDCIPLGLNAFGGVVGASGGHAFFWEDGITDLFPRGGQGYVANAINDAFVAVGAYRQQACLWDCRTPGPPFLLDGRLHPVSEALDLNENGRIVGWSAPSTGAELVATLWDERNTQLDLNHRLTPSGSGFDVLRTAVAIDRLDRIVVNGIAPDGALRAYLLTPAKAARGAACATDVNGSGDTGFDDLLAVLRAWGPCPGCPEDCNGDGIVATGDLVMVLSEWGSCP
jgi:probable HAF family extracellular repeat protein